MILGKLPKNAKKWSKVSIKKGTYINSVIVERCSHDHEQIGYVSLDLFSFYEKFITRDSIILRKIIN